MATRVPVKSILKHQNSTTPRLTPEETKAEKDRHNYAIALAHAHRLQDQKDWEARILKAIEVLIEYPSSAPFNSEEANNFTTLVQHFQPSDLDALVEERVIDRKCGYALCGNAPRSVTMGKEVEWKVACTRKSAYIETQLSPVPAWERQEDAHPRISLPPDDRSAAYERHAETSSQTAVKQLQQSAATAKLNNDTELALERGEQAASFRPKQVMTDRIVEKAATVYKPLSSMSGAIISSTAIEGYEPRGVKPKADGEKDDSDSDDEGDDDDEKAEQARVEANDDD
ncbi:hypothetical protein LTR97_005798 [Elasticomyces elasticus]|uniref:RNA polymerase II subunit B1 CTD phosphatase RPAP2 homolog n=1 Tax=Elasticomyces elasticus TaxID=574655 RepID=A0AAN7W8P1_9PEZI|nr:hypothetical protein LTR97_005798 [Elasticomyces elasticus]